MAGNDSVFDAIRQGFREAEDALMKLHTRFENDVESMRSVRDGQQTLGDLQELARNGIEGLLTRAGIPAYKTTHIHQYKLVQSWLEEVCLKKLFFTLLMMGKGPEEIVPLQSAIDAHFGKAYALSILQAAVFLAEGFAKASERQDFERITLIMRGTFVASPRLQEYYNQFSSGS